MVLWVRVLSVYQNGSVVGPANGAVTFDLVLYRTTLEGDAGPADRSKAIAWENTKAVTALGALEMAGGDAALL